MAEAELGTTMCIDANFYIFNIYIEWSEISLTTVFIWTHTITRAKAELG